ncbi:hypothetical protein FHW12_003953 [Dokdonella fugitiva]|uniref:Uncharacterized protein n=1 Tax=Dokdonella fugitiva TaxID=328517 RepID=A0A839F566_9GAMM|nr:hypothetical protein [Dokdonella fugitiva]MBA8889706.1 hypothetical protein [Dokdonella fugitiva]
MIKSFVAMALFSVGAFIWFERSQENSYRKTLDALEASIDYTFEVRDTWKIGSYVDRSAIWGVTGGGRLLSKISGRRNFSTADEHDLKFFEQLIASAKGTDISLSGYTLYRAEVPLGPGTICAALSCSIYIAVRPDRDMGYVGILKI